MSRPVTGGLMMVPPEPTGGGQLDAGCAVCCLVAGADLRVTVIAGEAYSVHI